jgi:hypothetical protein
MLHSESTFSNLHCNFHEMFYCFREVNPFHDFNNVGAAFCDRRSIFIPFELAFHTKRIEMKGPERPMYHYVIT